MIFIRVIVFLFESGSNQCRLKAAGACLLCAYIAAQLFCAPATAVNPQGRKVVDIRNEKLLVLPLSGFETFALMPGWPSDSGEINALVGLLAQIHGDIVAEFRRCEKYGMYQVVDSLHGPTVIALPQLSFEAVRNDSLFITMTLLVTNRATGKKLSIEIRTWGLFDPSKHGAPALNRIGLAFASYRRLFPSGKAVAFFYPERPEKNK